MSEDPARLFNQRSVSLLVGSIVEPFRYTRRDKANWIKENEASVRVVNLQKSNRGGQIWVNFGVYYRGISEEESKTVTEPSCHYRIRMGYGGVGSVSEDVACAILDLERPWMGDRPRSEMLTEEIEAYLRFLERIATLRQFAHLWKLGEIPKDAFLAGVLRNAAQELTGW